jgi:8-oxo-dGTP pyrophosphatase MutT (NUDIX family)
MEGGRLQLPVVMSVHSLPLFALLARYTPDDPEEAAMTARLRRFLAGLEDPRAAFGRAPAGCAPEWGHVTGSAWVVSRDGFRVVLVHHGKLNRWVQPGGHCDGDPDVLAVARRETREETGLDALPLGNNIFDVDVHPIPAHGDTPAHIHYDARFLLGAEAGMAPVASAESHAVRWVSLDEAALLNRGASVARMIAKTRRLAGP